MPLSLLYGGLNYSTSFVRNFNEQKEVTPKIFSVLKIFITIKTKSISLFTYLSKQKLDVVLIFHE